MTELYSPLHLVRLSALWAARDSPILARSYLVSFCGYVWYSLDFSSSNDIVSVDDILQDLVEGMTCLSAPPQCFFGLPM